MPTYKYPRPSVTTDCVVFGALIEHRTLQVLLIKRAGEPFKGCWALPGGFVDMGEDLETSARRELHEETGAEVDYLEQLYTFGAPERDPRGRVITVAYYALVRPMTVQAASDASAASWWALKHALDDIELAFDHRAILETAVARLRAKVCYEPIGFNLLPQHFTLRELRALYEMILGRKIDKRNFRRKILDMGILVEAGKQTDTSHRPAMLYRFDKKTYDKAVKRGLVFEI